MKDASARTEDQYVDVLCAIKFKDELAIRVSDRHPSVVRHELTHILKSTSSFIKPHSAVNSVSSELPFSVDIEKAEALLESAGATVCVAVEDMPSTETEGPIRQVLRERISNILTHAKSPAVEIVVTNAGITISNTGRDTTPSYELRSLERIQEEIAAHRVQLITTKKGSTFLTAAATIADADAIGKAPTRLT